LSQSHQSHARREERRAFLRQQLGAVQGKHSPSLQQFAVSLGTGSNIRSKSQELKVALPAAVLHCQGFPTGISTQGNKRGDGSPSQV